MGRGERGILRRRHPRGCGLRRRHVQHSGRFGRIPAWQNAAQRSLESRRPPGRPGQRPPGGWGRRGPGYPAALRYCADGPVRRRPVSRAHPGGGQLPGGARGADADALIDHGSPGGRGRTGVGLSGRPVVRQGRAPAADRVVQGARCDVPDRPPLAGRARGWRDRDLRGQPRSGGCRGCGPAGCPRRRRDADDRSALQGRRLPGLRRRGDPRGRGHVGGLGGDGADPRGARADVRPPVRSPRHHHRPGNDRPRDRRGSPGRGRCRRRGRGRRHGLRRGGGGQGAAARRPRLRRGAPRLQRPGARDRRRESRSPFGPSAWPTASTRPSPAPRRSPWAGACSTTSCFSTTRRSWPGCASPRSG